MPPDVRVVFRKIIRFKRSTLSTDGNSEDYNHYKTAALKCWCKSQRSRATKRRSAGYSQTWQQLKLLFRSRSGLCSWMNAFRKRRIPEGYKLCWHCQRGRAHRQTLKSVVYTYWNEAAKRKCITPPRLIFHHEEEGAALPGRIMRVTAFIFAARSHQRVRFSPQTCTSISKLLGWAHRGKTSCRLIVNGSRWWPQVRWWR